MPATGGCGFYRVRAEVDCETVSASRLAGSVSAFSTACFGGSGPPGHNPGLVGSVNPVRSLRSARRRSVSELRASAPRGCGPRGSKSRKFSLQYHTPASVAASPAQQSPGQKKTVATRGAKYNKGRHPLSCASARGLRPKSCVRDQTSPAPVQCPDFVRPRHANCR